MLVKCTCVCVFNGVLWSTMSLFSEILHGTETIQKKMTTGFVLSLFSRFAFQERERAQQSLDWFSLFICSNWVVYLICLEVFQMLNGQILLVLCCSIHISQLVQNHPSMYISLHVHMYVFGYVKIYVYMNVVQINEIRNYLYVWMFYLSLFCFCLSIMGKL